MPAAQSQAAIDNPSVCTRGVCARCYSWRRMLPPLRAHCDIMRWSLHARAAALRLRARGPKVSAHQWGRAVNPVSSP
eukprot:scaffold289695_cov36-Tisochrysis_lutea.AAC.2